VGVPARDVSTPLNEPVDLLFLGSSVYAAGVDAEIKRFLAELHAPVGKVVNFSTAALLPSTYKQVKKLAESRGLSMAEEEFHCRGSFKGMHKGRPDAKDLAAASAFAKAVVERAGGL
jgi:hypothetical protein